MINDELPETEQNSSKVTDTISSAIVINDDSQNSTTPSEVTIIDSDMDITDASNQTISDPQDMSCDQTDLADMQISTVEERKTSLSDNRIEIESVVIISPAEVSSDVQFEEDFFQQKSLVELARYTWESTAEKQMYTRGCLWSPDGTCILTAANLDGMHVIELPKDLYDADNVSPKRPLSKLQTAVHVPEGGTVYDYCWYPFMNSSSPESCCWLASRQHEPIHMWDAFTGELRCTYRSYDEVDEVQSAISVTFSPDGQLVIGGFKKAIKIFDTNRPGRDCQSIKTDQASSCFAISESSPEVIICGNWRGIINMYDTRMSHLGSLFSLYSHTGGVTYLKHTTDPNTLFSGARMENVLCQWDLRNFEKPVRLLNRKVETNQRIYFDVSTSGDWLASGDTDGMVHVWDVKSDYQKQFVFPLHNDCCNGVSFHPSRPVLGTCSGQYHFLENNEESAETTQIGYENSLIFWWVGSSQE